MIKPKILFIHTLNSATAYWRMYQFLLYLREEFDLAFFPHWDPNLQTTCYFEGGLHKNSNNIETITHLLNNTQLIIMQKVHTPEGLSLVNLIKNNVRKPLLMEVDDLYTNVNSDSPAHQVYRYGADAPYWANEQMETCDGVITSTEYLKGLFSKINDKVFVIPNGIDLQYFLYKKPKKREKIRIGWCGSSTHNRDLEILDKVISSFNGKVEFYFFGGVPDFLKNREGVTVDLGWVNLDKYFKKLKSLKFDIGLAPLRDSEFNRAKSNLRVLEYSALGIPTVASDVLPYRNTPALLCRDKKDWIKAIEKLYDEDYRIKKGQEAYTWVKENFDTPIVAKKYIEVLKEFI